MKTLNQFGLKSYFEELLNELQQNESVEFYEHCCKVYDDYKTSYDLQEGTNEVRHALNELNRAL